MYPGPEYHIRYAELGIIGDLFSTTPYPLRGKEWIQFTIALGQQALYNSIACRAYGIVEDETNNTFLPRRGYGK